MGKVLDTIATSRAIFGLALVLCFTWIALLIAAITLLLFMIRVCFPPSEPITQKECAFGCFVSLKKQRSRKTRERDDNRPEPDGGRLVNLSTRCDVRGFEVSTSFSW